MPSDSVWTLLGSAKKRRKCRNGKGERGKRITHLDYDYDDCGFLLHSTLCLVAATPPLICLKSTPTPTRLRETLPSWEQPLGGNLLYPRGFLPLPCKLPCRKSRLFSFSYKLQLSLRDFEDRRKDDDDDGGDGGDAQVVTAVGGGGGDGGNGRRFGRKGGRKETEKRSRSRRATSVRRSDHGKIHSNYTQHATRTMPSPQNT